MKKKRLLMVTPCCGVLSVGRICTDLAIEWERKGYEVKIGYGRIPYVPDIYKRFSVRIGNMIGVYFHALISLIFGYHATGWCSLWATKRFIKWAEKWNPDVLWLHNLHDNYVNVVELFKWIKTRPQMRVLWTQHDFWAMTGCCCCYTGECERWREGCFSCPAGTRSRRRGIFGGSESREFQTKKRAFLGVKDMTLICPSQWLADLFLQSYLSCYPIKVIKNTIDQEVFKPRRSDFRIKYNVQNDKIILAVAGFWEAPTKGFDDILKLSTLLRDNEKIVVVGLTDRLLKNLPQNIIGIRRTNNAEELAEIYSAANVFYNPTKLDNFPTVNLEARACECPVVTYDSGGCKETVEGYDKAIVLYGDQKTPEGFLNAARTAGYL